MSKTDILRTARRARGSETSLLEDRIKMVLRFTWNDCRTVPVAGKSNESVKPRQFTKKVEEEKREKRRNDDRRRTRRTMSRAIPLVSTDFCF